MKLIIRLCCQRLMNLEQLVGTGLAGDTEALKESAFQCHFIHYIPHMI
jgi:hypothetical protein